MIEKSIVLNENFREEILTADRMGYFGHYLSAAALLPEFRAKEKIITLRAR